MRSLAVNQSASRRAAATRRQILLLRPCTSCGKKRDTTQPLCEECRSEANKKKRKNKHSKEMETLINKAGITIAYFEGAENNFRQWMLDVGAGEMPPDRARPSASSPSKARSPVRRQSA